MRELVGAEVLVIDKDERVQKGITQLLSAASLHVTCASEVEPAVASLADKFYSVVVVDLDTPTPNAGLDTARQAKKASPTSMVVMLTPRKSFTDAVESIRAGAVDVILKSPESVQYLKDRVMEAAGRSVDKREVNSVLAEVKATQDEFLELFVGAEKRCVDLEDKLKGINPAASLDEIRILVVSNGDDFAKQLASQAPAGYHYEWALSGGQALDRVSSSRFHIAMVDSGLADLPSSMVTRSIKTQNPDLLVLEYSGPGPAGKLEIVDTRSRRTVVDPFTRADQLTSSLGDLTMAFREKALDRRYTQAFRERHYDFLRRYVELKIKIDRALSESG
jgi:DNA-binding NtrC family response regulator